MPLITPSPSIASSAQIAPGTVLGSDIANDTVVDANIGAHTTSKITVPTTLLSGTVTKAQLATGTQGDLLIYGAAGAPTALAAGTSGAFLKTQGAGANPTWATLTALTQVKCGVDSRNMATASGTQNIAHGLGVTPVFIKITAMLGTGVSSWLTSVGTYNGTTTACVYGWGDGTGSLSDSTNIINVTEAGASPHTQVATVTFNSTNIVLSWTRGGINGTNNAYLMWEAYA